MKDGSDTTSIAENPSVQTKPKKRFRGNAIKMLSKVSSQIVHENAQKLVQKLLDGALNGDLKSAALLITFIEKTPPTKARTGMSYRAWIQKLASEPPWTPPTNDSEDTASSPEHPSDPDSSCGEDLDSAAIH